MLARSPQAPAGAFAECDSERVRIGVIAKPRQGQGGSLLLADGAITLSRSGLVEIAGARDALPREVLYRSRPALACIIGARRAWTVEMISSEEIPCR